MSYDIDLPFRAFTQHGLCYLLKKKDLVDNPSQRSLTTTVPRLQMLYLLQMTHPLTHHHVTTTTTTQEETTTTTVVATTITEVEVVATVGEDATTTTLLLRTMRIPHGATHSNCSGPTRTLLEDIR